MTVSYFLVFLLILVVAFIISYFFRDTIKRTVKRILGGGEVADVMDNMYSMNGLKSTAEERITEATKFVSGLKAALPTDGSLKEIKDAAEVLLQKIQESADTVDKNRAKYKADLASALLNVKVDFEKITTAVSSKKVGKLRGAFKDAGLDPTDVAHPEIDDGTFKTGKIDWDKLKKNFENMEGKLIAKYPVEWPKVLAAIKPLPDLFNHTNDLVTEMENLNGELKKVHQDPRLAQSRHDEVVKLDKQLEDSIEEYNKLIKAEIYPIITTIPKQIQDLITDIRDRAKRLRTESLKKGKEYHAAINALVDLQKGIKIGTTTSLTTVKEWIDEWKKALALYDEYKKFVDVHLKNIAYGKLFVDLVKNSSPLWVHEDTVVALENVDKHILGLGYTDVHTDLTELGRLKVLAKTPVANISSHKSEIPKHIAAFDNAKLHAEIKSYVKDLTTLESLKRQALSIKESAEVKAAQERSLDSSSGDYVFDSQEIISDTKFEEMMSQGKDDEIKATFFKNLVDNDIPKKEIEKIIQKRKEKLRQKRSPV